MAMKRAFKEAFPKSLPVFFGYVTLGIGFGLLLDSAGYGPFWAFIMSSFIFSGSAQYVAVDVMSFGTIIEAALLILVVNFRHVFYGLSMLKRYEGAGWRRPYLIHTLTDETFAIAVTYEENDSVNPHDFYFALSLLDQSYWLLGSMIGAFIPKLVTFNTQGVDFSMTALFVVLMIDQLKNRKNHGPAFVGALVSVGCLIVLGSKNFLIPSLLIISAVLMILRSRFEVDEHE